MNDQQNGLQIKLLHSVPRAKLSIVLQEGLKAASCFDDLGLEMRQNVVYCWLKKEHDKMWRESPDYVCVDVTVGRNRCQVADMDFASIAMMYHQGSGGRPKNSEAAHLLAEVYRVTSVPLDEYREGMFLTPEVLVKGNIEPGRIRVPNHT